MLTVRDKNREKAEDFKKENNHDFVIKNGYRYLGSFIGEKEAEMEWLVLKIENWNEALEQVVKMAKFEPQSAYAGIQRALQQEWTFIQRAIPNIANLFSGLKKSIHASFFYNLF